MLTDYIKGAMRQATYEILEDDGSFYGHIPGFKGLWANAPTLEGCRDELQEVLEEWLFMGIYWHHNLPIVEDIDLNFDPNVVEEVEEEEELKVS